MSAPWAHQPACGKDLCRIGRGAVARGRGRRRSGRARELRLPPGVLLLGAAAIALSSPAASAKVFDVGEVDGILDVTVAYGLLVRTQSRDQDFIGIGNGGRADSVNGDDGTLNYDTGLISNELRLSADLTLLWRNFGAFVRGYGFYDFATELKNVPLKDLSELGGWKNAETILKRYQWPDTETQCEALRARQAIRRAKVRS